jgi:hypothetical protein
MKYVFCLLTLGLAATFTTPAPAGILFGRHTKPTPEERESQLIITVKTDADEGKRATAAKELRTFDPRTFPEIVPILVDVLKHDPKASVRLEAAQTLGKLRPVSQEAGMALEEAANDSSWRVRWQAHHSLLGYRMSGYRSPPKVEQASPSSGKQSPYPPPSGTTAKRGLFPSATKTGPVLVPRETPPPPLADPIPPAPPSAGAQQKLSRPTPVETLKLQKPPSGSAEEGPDLPREN